MSSQNTIKLEKTNQRQSRKSQDTKVRSKNFSADECSALLRFCHEFHTTINKNSHSDKELALKNKCWDEIKIRFDKYCESEGIDVSSTFLSIVLYSSDFVRPVDCIVLCSKKVCVSSYTEILCKNDFFSNVFHD